MGVVISKINNYIIATPTSNITSSTRSFRRSLGVCLSIRRAACKKKILQDLSLKHAVDTYIYGLLYCLTVPSTLKSSILHWYQKLSFRIDFAHVSQVMDIYNSLLVVNLTHKTEKKYQFDLSDLENLEGSDD